jgi:hypothetical protein
VNFDLFVGTPEHQRNAGDPVHLLAFLGEGEKAFGDGSVRVKIFGPNGFGPFELDLFDDGLHGDGSVKDGIYGNHFLDGDLPGAYAVRGVAKGNNMLGQAFEIYKNTGFNLRPRIAYLLKDDAETAVAYEAWIEQNGVGVDLIHMDSVPHVNLNKYRMFIVGPDTGFLDEWGNGDIVGNLLKFERPILGLGEGGYAFFGKIQARIGYANGAHSDGASVQEQLSADAFWHYPYEMSMGDPKVWQLYQENSRRVDSRCCRAGPDKSAALRSPRHGQALRQPDHGERVLDALGLPGRPEADDDGRTPALHQRGVPHDAVRAFLLVYE